jgi:hypothetical protein
LRPSYRSFQLKATLKVQGTARLFWDYHAPLGPDKPQADATLHPLMRTRHQAVELSDTGWKVINVDAEGKTTTLASGSVDQRPEWMISLNRKPDGSTTLAANGKTLWTANANKDAEAAPGAIGLLVEPHSHLSVKQFRVAGEPVEGGLTYLYTEALHGAGDNILAHTGHLGESSKPAGWQERHEASFRYGEGVVSLLPDARVKWNVIGTQMTLWSPRGPEFGKVEIRLDGQRKAVLDLHSSTPEPSRPVWTSEKLPDAGHAVILQSVSGVFPVDCLTVSN